MNRAAALGCCVVAVGTLAGACSNDPSGPVGPSTAPDGSDTAGDGTVPQDLDIEVELRTSQESLPLGAPFEYTVAISNHGPKSVSVPLDLVLTAPSGDDVSFYTTTLFAPAGAEVTEDGRVTPSQWFADRGRYRVAVTAYGDAAGDSLELDVSDPTVVVPVFEDVTASAGVSTSVPEATCGRFSNGAAWGDVDGDDDDDLFVTRLDDRSQLFINDGDGGFVDESEGRGLAINDTNGAAFADYDNDGDADLIVVRDGSDLLFENDGDGRFGDVSVAAGIGDDGFRGMNASWGDFDNDGNLDLYVTNYMTCTGEWATEEEIISQVSYYPDTLYRNKGDGTFSDVTSYLENDPETRDDGSTIGAGFGAAWFDYDSDGRLDLYLANDFVGPSPDSNRLWHNDGPVDAGQVNGDWRFTDVSVASGTSFFMNTMGIGVGDFDRDRDLDLALSNIGANKLVRNEGDGLFTDELTTNIARPLQDASYSSITWGTNFHDLNLDGWEDLHLAAGNLYDRSVDAIGPQPNEVYVYDSAGERYLDVSAATGADDEGDSKGVAFADYDRDGDMDMFVINQGGEPHLYRNDTPTEGQHWLQVDTVGTSSNRDGCGARIILELDDGVMTRQVSCGSGGGGAGSQHAVHFGLGASTTVRQLEVIWPSGTRQILSDIEVDTFVMVEELAS
ncbi:MAG TPA: CRTAC1 family protein [Ilumatobacteraceae bacterium]|nr:CRTAC1 family protein [Ilumatobacteraceae bacterium]